MSAADSSSRRIMHVFLPTLATDRLAKARRRAEAAAPSDPEAERSDAAPWATVAKVRGALIIEAVDARAEAFGISSGLTLAEARAQVPALRIEPADADADAATLLALARAADRYTPLVGLDPSRGLFLDVSGCAHLFGGEAKMAADVIARLAAWGFRAHVAIAESTAVAWAMARYAADDGPPIVAHGEGFAAVAPLPVEALRLPEETVAVLMRLGLKTVAQLLRQPRAPLVQRFGPAMARRIDQIEGREREPITPLSPLAPFVVERRFAEPLIQIEGVAACVAKLAERLADSLDVRGEGARRLTVKLFHTDGAVRDASVGASEPLADPKRIAALLSPRLDALSQRIETDCGIDLIRLLAEETGPRHARQGDLEARHGAVADLASLVDTLSERLGPEAVQRFLHVDTHQPGEADERVAARDALEPPAWPQPRDAGERAAQPAPPVRPLKLFDQPEPVETLASVPDGPPVRFVWRRVFYHVAAAEGPERIAPSWWQDESGKTCDYFRVEDVDGRRFWMFRRGLYEGAEPPRWYVHGLFA